MTSSQPQEVVDDWHMTREYSELKLKQQQAEYKDCNVYDADDSAHQCKAYSVLLTTYTAAI